MKLKVNAGPMIVSLITNNTPFSENPLADMEGTCQAMEIRNVQELAEVLRGLKLNQALVTGFGSLEESKIMGTIKYKEAGQPDGSLTCTNDSFYWLDCTGLLLLDFQMHDTLFTKEKARELITQVVPQLSQSAYIWRDDLSGARSTEAGQVGGYKKQRFYLLVEDANDIERAGRVLCERLWLAGYGQVALSWAGRPIYQCPLNNDVWKPCYMDFPVSQSEFVVNEGVILDTKKALPDLTNKEREKLNVLYEQATETKHSEIIAAKKTYIKQRVKQDLQSRGIINPTDIELNRANSTVLKALDYQLLTSDFILFLANGTNVTVGEVLKSPESYHQAVVKDPLEPNDDRYPVASLSLFGGSPRLEYLTREGYATEDGFYMLMPQPLAIEHIKGDTKSLIDKTLHVLRQSPHFYDMGEELIIVSNNRPLSMDEALLSYHLSSIIDYYASTERSGKLKRIKIDPPIPLLKGILSLGSTRRLKKLKAVINSPIITRDDHLLDRIGYDATTGLYLAAKGSLPVAAKVNKVEALKALNFLMKPFSQFPFNGPEDKGVCLAAVLTALTRPALNKSPAFAIDAPKQGTGKTYLAQCIGLLASGHIPTALPPLETRNDEEVRKRLFSALLSGVQVILWDNVMGAFNSGSLAALLTAETFADRVLGRSETREVFNHALFLITGNNLSIGGDLARRILVCRLDSKHENPTMRSFSFDPLSYIKTHRAQLVQKGLTLIRGYLQSEANTSLGGVKADKLASFEDWDTVSRQVVAWVATFDASYADPKQVIDSALMKDPQQELLYSLLNELQKTFQARWFTAKEVCDAANNVLGNDHVKQSALRELLEEITLGKFNSLSVGRALGYRRDRIVDGLRLAHRQQGKKAAMYQVEVLEAQLVLEEL